MTDAGRLGVAPSEIAIDLLILAALVYAADTRLPRSGLAQNSWSREIKLEVPVSNVARWTAAAPLLRRMLRFLSGDIWEFDFRLRPDALMQLGPARALPPAYDGLCLFSGGLDSLVGAIDLLAAGRRPMLISHASEGATSDAQNQLIERLRGKYAPIDRLRFWIGFPDTGPRSRWRQGELDEISLVLIFRRRRVCRKQFYRRDHDHRAGKRTDIVERADGPVASRIAQHPDDPPVLYGAVE